LNQQFLLTSSGCRGRHRTHAGIALVLVLWVLSLLTVMALSLTMTQRSQSALVRNQLDSARFRAMAEGAVNLAVLNLISDPRLSVGATEVCLPDGSPHLVELGGERIEVRIFNEASRIDLNSITPSQLRRLLELAGAEPDQADAIADAVADWRDCDDLTSLNGAEDDTYAAEGYGYGAADQDFESLEELQLVHGMTPELFAKLAPELRVGGSGGGRQSLGPVFGASSRGGRSTPFDARFASPMVLAAMEDITLEEAELRVIEREQPVVPGAEQPAAVERGGPDYRIRVTLWQGERAARARETLVRTEARGSPGFEVLAQREGLAVTSAPLGDDGDARAAADALF
jgi:general secretion pathway protein K